MSVLGVGCMPVYVARAEEEGVTGVEGWGRLDHISSMNILCSEGRCSGNPRDMDVPAGGGI